MNKTKIIATVGPATNSEEMIQRIKESGVDFIRLNMSHASLEELESTIALAKKINIPFILDTEGPQIRTGELIRNCIVFNEGDEIKIHKNEIKGDEKNICLKPGLVIDLLNVGDLVSLDFGTLLLKISDISIKKEGYVLAKVITGGVLGRNKSAVIDSLNNSLVNLPILSEKDLKALEIALKNNIEYMAASFVRNEQDIFEVRKLSLNKMKIISKIETKESLENLDKIIDNSDYCLIDRGDLSKEIPLDKIPLTQKIILSRAKKKGTPVFIATNLLESMIENPKPTRAELNDITNSLLDGASGLALCAETAIGKYPLEAINMLNKMIKNSEIITESDVINENSNNIVKRLEELNYIDKKDVDSSLIEPHGGKLVNRMVNSIEQDYIDSLYKIKMDKNKEMDVEQIAIGTFSPLEGFMNEKDFIGVLDNMRLSNGIPWTIPIIFDIEEKTAENLKIGQTIALEGYDGVMAIMNIEDKYTYDKLETSKKWFGTLDEKHPGVARLMKMGNVLIGGKINLIKRRKSEYKEYELTPSQARKIFEEKGWSRIVGFHTRNVIHRGHEYIQLDAVKKNYCDGLFVHPVIGQKKEGDFNTKFIVKSYERMMKKFYPKNKVVFGVFSTFSRYGGPREAIFTAICRKNFGCSHFIVGRDHTGVGDFYQPEDSHKIFDKFPDLGIKPIKYKEVFYSKIHNRYVHEEEFPNHPENEKLHISGTQARKMIENMERPPEWFMRPEISNDLIEAVQNGEEVFIKNNLEKKPLILAIGLSGSGKTYNSIFLEKNLDNYLRINPEIIRKELNIESYSRKDTPKVLSKAIENIENSYNQGKNVIFDANLKSNDLRQCFYDLAKHLKINIIILEFFCDEEECKKRMQNRDSLGIKADHPRNPKIYEDQLKVWQDISKDFEISGNEKVCWVRYNSFDNKAEIIKETSEVKEFVKELIFLLENKER